MLKWVGLVVYYACVKEFADAAASWLVALATALCVFLYCVDELKLNFDQ